MLRPFSVFALVLLPMANGQEHPGFQGVWKLHESTPSAESILWITLNGADLKVRNYSGSKARYTINDTEFTIGAERQGTLQRMPARFKANWEGDALVLDWAAVWPWGEQSEHHRWTLSADGRSFHDEFTDTFKTRVRPHSGTFDRAPDDAAKVFDSPEQTSGEHYKNIQLLKDLPASALTPLMGSYQSALGVDCTFCHNQAAYDSDEKPAKKMARKMITMTLDLNQREFAGREAITCATCHRGKTSPGQE